MKVFAIGDLHLPGRDAKSMDIFGAHWDRHFVSISNNWNERVAQDDVVLIPGDISWAMRIKDVESDLHDISVLPGLKILLRGNHDYWWSAIGQVRSILPKGMFALQNDAIVIGEQVFCGARGWIIPAEEQSNANDERIYAREVLRLKMSLTVARRIAPDLPLTVLMHFPPACDIRKGSDFLALALEYGASRLVYGHLHGIAQDHEMPRKYKTMYLHLVSCDTLGFRLLDLDKEESLGR
jgi:predicted phosphohydrolase